MSAEESAKEIAFHMVIASIAAKLPRRWYERIVPRLYDRRQLAYLSDLHEDEKLRAAHDRSWQAAFHGQVSH